ncbi:MAG TPA: hypothetical protein ENJ51_08050 [Leucothrix mucor]|uniref:SGNH domain-containing protein n=1 Tax=Leucothrix mucor TaxID=45248 RepID=A0A7V2WV33_LEUMU|nr:hypothetical protein [Leucothrix mucor]
MFVININSKALFITVLTLCTMLFAGNASANSAQKELLKLADTKASGEYVRSRFLKAMTKTINPNATKKALIIGDSHAQDFLNSVLENNYLKHYQIKTRYIPTRCQIYLGGNHEKLIAQKDKALCAKADNLSRAKEEIAKADLVILSAKWRKWAAERLPQTIQKLGISAKQKLVVIGVKSFGRVSIRKYLRMSDDQLRKLRNKIDGNQDEVNEIMKKSISKNVFVNTHQLICGTTSTCPLFTKNLNLISFDGGHLTPKGAQYVGKVLFQGAVLSSIK